MIFYFHLMESRYGRNDFDSIFVFLLLILLDEIDVCVFCGFA